MKKLIILLFLPCIVFSACGIEKTGSFPETALSSDTVCGEDSSTCESTAETEYTVCDTSAPPDESGTEGGFILPQLSCAVSVTEEEKSTVREELSRILLSKGYSDTAKELVCLALEIAIEDYEEYSELFAFTLPLDPLDHFRTYITEPIKYGVENLYYACTESPEDVQALIDMDYPFLGAVGKMDGEAGTLIINAVDLAGSDETDHNRFASVLLHELYHAAVQRENSAADSFYYYSRLNEGFATLHQLSVADTLYGYTCGSYLYAGCVSYNTEEGRLDVCGCGENDVYALYSNNCFKLLALTDRETADLFFKPSGHKLIEQALKDRYGSDGEKFFESILFKNDLAQSVEQSELLFIKLFMTRLDQISSGQEMRDFIQLYRLYRLAFATKYTVYENGEMLESPYEPFALEELDRAVAGAALEWKITSISDKEQAYAALRVILGCPVYKGAAEFALHREALDHQRLLLSEAAVSVTPSGDKFTVEVDGLEYLYDPQSDTFIFVKLQLDNN